VEKQRAERFWLFVVSPPQIGGRKIIPFLTYFFGAQLDRVKKKHFQDD